METNLTSLTRQWIEFLKINKIVDRQSNPKTGRLNYKRNPNVQELIRFVVRLTDFDQEDVKAAIKAVVGSKGQAGEAPKSLAAPEQPTQPKTPALGAPTPPNPSTQEPTPSTKKYSNDGAEDIPFKDPGQPPALTHKKKPRFKYKGPGQDPERIREAFYDNQGVELSEDDIKQIFKILLTPKAEPEEPDTAGPSPEEETEQKQEYMRKLKQMIREVMTPAQRKALWRALAEPNLSEAIINRSDAEEVFKDAAYLRSKPTGLLGKMFKGHQKEKIDVEDLRQAWANGLEGDGSDGYSNDTNDIKRIMLKFGYDEKEINKVFAQVFKTDDSEYDDTQDAPVASENVQKVADIAKKHGLTKSLRSFLEQEFAKELGLEQEKKKGWFGKKATNEDIRQIFTTMIQEERTARIQLIRQEEQTQLGRQRK
jgi:hypothetical protein